MIWLDEDGQNAILALRGGSEPVASKQMHLSMSPAQDVSNFVSNMPRVE